jgi:hypothetical protein
MVPLSHTNSLNFLFYYVFLCMFIQARIAKDLIELRNQSVFAFFVMNALFVLIVFLLQLNKDTLHVNWPFGVKTNISFDEVTQEVSLIAVFFYLLPTGSNRSRSDRSPKQVGVCILHVQCVVRPHCVPSPT